MREELLNALAHDRFISLFNFGDRWELKHWNDNGESACLVDKHLDRLLETWIRIVNQIEAAEAAEEMDCRDYPV